MRAFLHATGLSPAELALGIVVAVWLLAGCATVPEPDAAPQDGEWSLVECGPEVCVVDRALLERMADRLDRCLGNQPDVDETTEPLVPPGRWSAATPCGFSVESVQVGRR